MTKEDRREISTKGLLLGLVLFVSTLIYLLASTDMEHLRIVGTILVPVIAGYGVIGIFIVWLVYRSTLRKSNFSIFSGAAAIYWIWMISVIIMFASNWIPQVLRYIVLVNSAVLLVVWLLDYLYLKRIATELNSGLGYYSRKLVVDLSAKPQTEDMFMNEIENYCQKNNLTLEVLEYGMPAKIKMNNTLYQVQLGQYYTMIGTLIYTLEFNNMISKSKNSTI